MPAIRQRESGARLTLEEIRQLTAAVAQEEDPSLEVVAAVGRGGQETSEVVLAHWDGALEAFLAVVRVDRYASESELRLLVRQHLREQRRLQRA
jgi:hypothetical protein